METKDVKLVLEEKGTAQRGMRSDEVVIGVGPGFGTRLTKSIKDVPHGNLIRELIAGLEEEGMSYRLIKILHSADLGVIGNTAAKYSGSGYAIGILSKGTCLIHQKDLVPLDNIELYSVSPLLSLENYRAIAKNAAKYAKGDVPTPVSQPYDGEAIGATYMAKAAVMHLTEATQVIDSAAPIEYEVKFEIESTVEV